MQAIVSAPLHIAFPELVPTSLRGILYLLNIAINALDAFYDVSIIVIMYLLQVAVNLIYRLRYLTDYFRYFSLERGLAGAQRRLQLQTMQLFQFALQLAYDTSQLSIHGRIVNGDLQVFGGNDDDVAIVVQPIVRFLTALQVDDIFLLIGPGSRRCGLLAAGTGSIVLAGAVADGGESIASEELTHLVHGLHIEADVAVGIQLVVVGINQVKACQQGVHLGLPLGLVLGRIGQRFHVPHLIGVDARVDHHLVQGLGYSRKMKL